MAEPEYVKNITTFGDRILYHMSQVYAAGDVSDPPNWRESWSGIAAVLVYYMTNGWRFT